MHGQMRFISQQCGTLLKRKDYWQEHMRQKHHVEFPTEEKQKKQNQDCLLHNPEKVDSFHKKLDEILHLVIEEFGITMQSSTSETWSSPPITDISLGVELNIQL